MRRRSLVDVEDHDFDFLTDVHDLGRIDVLVGPIHFRDVHQSLDALFDFNEAAVVGDVRDLAEEPRVGRIAACDVLPRIRAQLLQAEGDALTFAIELENAHVDLFADLDHFGGMLDALPGHVGDVQQAVDAAEIHECAVIGEVLDHALDRRALLQIVEQRGTFGAVFLFDHGPPRHDDVVALLIELDDLELERLVLEIGRIAYRPHIDQRSRQERPDIVDLDRESALDASGDDADDHFLLFERGLEPGPGARALGFLAGQAGFPGTVLHAVQGHLDGLADDNFDLALFVLELFRRYDGFGFQSNVDDDVVLAYFDDQPVEDGARTDALAGNALFEQFGKTFSHVFSVTIPLALIPCASRG